jgi:imidazole glycerol-phosphate synthase subunit HisH
MIGILDYGVGNITSIANMLDYLNIPYIFIKEKSEFNLVSKLILPGVGSFDYAMIKLLEKDLINSIKLFAYQKKIIIGICLGMQLLGKSSEEGNELGLNLVDYDVKSLKGSTKFNVPNIGWSQVSKSLVYFDNSIVDKYYFVHSFYVPLTKDSAKYETIMTCDYGFQFSAGIKKDNIYGFQFHPEKSHKFGMNLFKYINNL